MLKRYIEQQAAVSTALMSTEIRRNARDIDTLDCNDISEAEDVVKRLKPLKTATTVLCDEKLPTVSLTVPLKNMVEQSMSPSQDNSPTVAGMKAAILADILDRYAGDAYAYSGASANEGEAGTTARGPATAHRAAELREAAQGEELDLAQAGDNDQPPSKKNALEDLFGDSFIAPPESVLTGWVEKEIEMYMSGTCIPLSYCPLKWWKENSHVSNTGPSGQSIPLSSCYLGA
ncbi:hypothetical protein SKAU_G00103030 [Synaphobranchus kaupii]|uniref:Uncharacterized protein n=1 Tax=Synaphobranchus kaupii TaxID=118154 RepID=A0A9Q1J5F8_SYNKA|nr:hypothetical protein SKAU_G00103030 [Synaphobranchus kaupii]